MATQDYRKQLKSPEWQKKRLEIFQRDNWTCTACKCTDLQLQVHHIEYFYGTPVWEYPNDMLITLCFRCHEKQNGANKIYDTLIQSLRIKGFLTSDISALSTIIYTDPTFTNNLLTLLRKIQNG